MGPQSFSGFGTYLGAPAYDDVTYVYDDVTYVYDDVTYVYDDVTYAGNSPVLLWVRYVLGGTCAANNKKASV